MTALPEALARLTALGTIRSAWLPGMRADYHDGCCQRVVADDEGDGTLCPGPDATPDLSDPATVGCLAALAREAWGDPHMHSRWSESGNRWEAIRGKLASTGSYVKLGRVAGAGPTEGEAWAAALIAKADSLSPKTGGDRP